MPRMTPQKPPTGHVILVVDDDRTIVSTLERILTQEGHTVLSATSGVQAVELCRASTVHLMLLDYFMPDLTGEAVIRAVREFNPEVQIVLQTGYASERPARQMLAELDIQGYHDKSEGPEKLMIWVDAGLKSYRQVRALRASSAGMRRILQAAPELTRLQPLGELLSGLLVQMEALLGLSGTLIALRDDRLAPERANLEVHLGTGRFSGKAWVQLGEDERKLILEAAETQQPSGEGLLALPLGGGERMVGVILVDRRKADPAGLEVLQLFASQAAVAIENARLYERATVDALTGLATRRRWMLWLDDALKSAYRHAHTFSLLLLRAEGLGAIRERHGPQAAEQALAELSRSLTYSLRRSDGVGRLGEETLAVLLPHTDLEALGRLAEKLRQVTGQTRIDWGEGTLHLTASLGAATLRFRPGYSPHSGLLETVRSGLLEAAEAALAQAQASGKGQVSLAEPLEVGALRPLALA